MRRYISKSLVELPILIMRLDGKEDILTIHTYLVDAEIPFLCGKRTLEDWSFQIDGREKILEISSKTDGSRIQVRMIDTKGGHYGIILETQGRKALPAPKSAPLHPMLVHKALASWSLGREPPLIKKGTKYC